VAVITSYPVVRWLFWCVPCRSYLPSLSMKLADWDVTVCWPGGQQYCAGGQPDEWPRLGPSWGVGRLGTWPRSKRGVPRRLAINHARVTWVTNAVRRRALMTAEAWSSQPASQPQRQSRSFRAPAHRGLCRADPLLTRRRRRWRYNDSNVVTLKGTAWYEALALETRKKISWSSSHDQINAVQAQAPLEHVTE